jgi:hypothetical protein
MKLSLSPKLVEKLIIWVLVISFCKISFPIKHFDGLLRQNWSFSSPNCLIQSFFKT